MSAIPQSTSGLPQPWQTGFLAALPTVQNHARSHFRRLPAADREEAIQEAIASACCAYQKLAISGKLHVCSPHSLASYAVKQVRSGRHVGGSQDSARDVLSPIPTRLGEIQVLSLDQGDWEPMLRMGRHGSVPDLAAFRIDFGTWICHLSPRDRRIVSALAAGEKTCAVAQRFGISRGRVSQLRREYERSWWQMQGEAAVAAA